MTVTNNRSIYLPLVGGDSGTWGTLQNSGVFEQLDLILGATQTVTITVANVTLTQAQWNNCAISLSGTLTADRSLILPLHPNSATVAVGGYFCVENATGGAFNVTVKTAAVGSVGVTVPQGLRTWLYSNGTDVKYADDSKVYIVGVDGTPTGQLAGTAGTVNNPPFPFAHDYTNKKLYMPTTSGTAASTVWQQVLTNSSPIPVALFSNLVIKVLTNTTASVAATGVSVTDGSSNYLIVAPSSTINFATTGANGLDTGAIATSTWYAIWVIAKADGTTAAIASTSFTFAGLSPNLPSGYIYAGRVGALRTSSSVAQLRGTWQLGRTAVYKIGLAQTAALPKMDDGNHGTYDPETPSWGSAVSVATFVPTTASQIMVTAVNRYNSAAAVNVLVAPTSSYGGPRSDAKAPPISLNANTENGLDTCAILLEATSIVWVSGGGGGAIFCVGWEDNI